jgi:hypothetical protein
MRLAITSKEAISGGSPTAKTATPPWSKEFATSSHLFDGIRGENVRRSE